MRLFVGNLPYSATENQLNELFGQFGEVANVKIILDRETNRSRGFGFVELPNKEEAEKAIKELDGTSLNDRNLVVKEAQERESRPPRGGNNRNGRPFNKRNY